MEPETKQQIAEQAEVLGECLTQMKANIPKDLLPKDLKLGAEELQAMATSIYISVSKRGNGNSNGAGAGGEGDGNYDGESTSGQHDLIKKLEGEINKIAKDEGTAIVKGYLDDNGQETLEGLSKSEASSLCTTLIDAKKSMRQRK